jgi:hypothetical protein
MLGAQESANLELSERSAWLLSTPGFWAAFRKLRLGEGQKAVCRDLALLLHSDQSLGGRCGRHKIMVCNNLDWT